MKRNWATLIVLMCLTATSASSQVDQLPQGRFSTLLVLEWEPDCEAFWPINYGSRSDPRVDVLGVERWTRCVREQAEADLLVAARAISEGRRKAAARKRMELDRGY
jgi:hypothetical protein